MKRPSRDPNVKARAMAMYRAGVLETEIRKELGIGHKTIRKWVTETYEVKTEKVITPAPYARGFRWGAG